MKDIRGVPMKNWQTKKKTKFQRYQTGTATLGSADTTHAKHVEKG